MRQEKEKASKQRRSGTLGRRGVREAQANPTRAIAILSVKGFLLVQAHLSITTH